MLKFQVDYSENWTSQQDSAQILTLDTKKYQLSAPVAKPRLFFASLPLTMHCFLYFFNVYFPFFLLFVNCKTI